MYPYIFKNYNIFFTAVDFLIWNNFDFVGEIKFCVCIHYIGSDKNWKEYPQSWQGDVSSLKARLYFQIKKWEGQCQGLAEAYLTHFVLIKISLVIV